ncbi:MMS ZWEI homologue 1 [Prunus dulcis]|uniref:MMS ZWEI homologue 1 n=1 Tax=Prunus dulcis TaxID=3755 RepID=A0A4Y1QP62_PRUDU|nr:MMS ZWEI homologue 1 [Prunus dulcis]
MEEIGATVVVVYMRMVGFIDPATVSANSGTIAERSRLVADRLQKTDGEQIFMITIQAYKLTTGPSLDLADCKSKEGNRLFSGSSAGNRVVDEEGKNIVNSAIKIYNSHIARAGVNQHTKATQQCRMRVLCMRFMRDIIMDPSLAFEKKYAKGKQEAPYPKKQLMKSGMNGQSLFANFVYNI